MSEVYNEDGESDGLLLIHTFDTSEVFNEDRRITEALIHVGERTYGRGP